MQYHNHDLEHIYAPIDVQALARLLRQSFYDKKETQFLIQGFSQGFNIGYAGPRNRSDTANNIPFTVGNKVELVE